ncbi:RnfH family protein [Basilea psittacipulmonis]|uniref:RnfH family protein n=1 Tax=Basilea psittacipulmonis TaxID=1472345 RepID=UPI00068B3784|nr:RnfH family protein [Basilea psittacipulmonis]
MVNHKVSLYFVDAQAHIWQKHIAWSENLTVQTALEQADFFKDFPHLSIDKMGLAIFGKKIGLEDVLKPTDRIEICRELSFDPMESRRRRAAHKAQAKKQPPPRRLKKVKPQEHNRLNAKRKQILAEQRNHILANEVNK